MPENVNFKIVKVVATDNLIMVSPTTGQADKYDWLEGDAANAKAQYDKAELELENGEPKEYTSLPTVDPQSA